MGAAASVDAAAGTAGRPNGELPHSAGWADSDRIRLALDAIPQTADAETLDSVVRQHLATWGVGNGVSVETVAAAARKMGREDVAAAVERAGGGAPSTATAKASDSGEDAGAAGAGAVAGTKGDGDTSAPRARQKLTARERAVVAARKSKRRMGLMRSALRREMCRDDVAEVQALLTAGVDLWDGGHLHHCPFGYFDPLPDTAIHNSTGTLRKLIKAMRDDARFPERARKALRLALMNGSKEAACLLMDTNVDVEDDAGTVVAAAISGRVNDFARELMARGVRVDGDRGFQPFVSCIRVRNLPMARELLDASAHPMEGKVAESQLRAAAEAGALDFVLEILRRGADAIDCHDRQGLQLTTSLINALVNGHLHVARALLDHGAAPTGTAGYPQYTALLVIADEYNRPLEWELLGLELLERGADPHAKMIGDVSVVRLATNNANLLILRALLNRGVDISHVDGRRQTALCECFMSKRKSNLESLAVMLLRQAGARWEEVRLDAWCDWDTYHKLDEIDAICGYFHDLLPLSRPDPTPPWEAVSDFFRKGKPPAEEWHVATLMGWSFPLRSVDSGSGHLSEDVWKNASTTGSASYRCAWHAGQVGLARDVLQWLTERWRTGRNETTGVVGRKVLLAGRSDLVEELFRGSICRIPSVGEAMLLGEEGLELLLCAKLSQPSGGQAPESKG